MKTGKTKTLAVTALLLAMNIIMSMSMFSIPVPGGHMYLNDLVICTAAILLSPFYAFVVGGIGAFLGDMFFYPYPMFVSLVTHGVQAVVISLCTRRLLKNHREAASIIGAVLGLIITVAGYTFGRAYIYGTVEYAIVKLPYQILQTAVGEALSLLLCWRLRLVSIFEKQFGKQ